MTEETKAPETTETPIPAIQPEVVKPKIPPKLTPDRIQGADFIRVVYAITPAIGTEVEHFLKPEYWAHVAAKLRPHTRIEAVSEDNSWFAEMIVMSCGPNWAKVKVLRFVPLEDASADQVAQRSDSAYEVVWAGVKAKFRVIHKTDKTVAKEGFQNKGEAHKWLQDYELNALVS